MIKKYNIKVNGTIYEVEVEECGNDNTARKPAVNSSPSESKKTEPTVSADQANGESLKAPMPGIILKVNVKPGDTVKQGNVLLVLEAMKMENDIVAPRDCVISSVPVSQGNSVDTGAPLVYFN